MDLAKILAWQKIFRGRSTNLKIGKSGFFFAFSLRSPPVLSHFPIPSERIKLQPKILILRGRSTDKKKICFFSPIFLALISCLNRKFRSFWSDNELRVHYSLDRSRSSLSDQKERNFRFYTLTGYREMKYNRGWEYSENAKKKTDFSIFKFVERPLNIFCEAKSFARSIILPKGTKFSGETKN